jgi:AcrR family transcriptional regulator
MAAAHNPLFDTLFRSTAPAPAESRLSSAPPVREAGTHSRAGNAMGRTRAALLTGARHAVEASGTKITMAQVATSAGVAKATLYNHFRTREAVLAALVEAEVSALVAALAERPLPEALAAAADELSGHPVLRALARLEPATLARLAVVSADARGWQLARAGVSGALTRDGRGGTEFVLRWLASFILSPARPAAIAADLAILLAGLPDAAPAAEQSARPA